MFAGAVFGVALADSALVFLGFFGFGGASGLVSDFRGLPRRRGVFSGAPGSCFCAALTGPFSSGAGAVGAGAAGAAGCCRVGIAVAVVVAVVGAAAVALLRFLGGAWSSSSLFCVRISAPPIVEGVEDGAAGRC